MLNTNIRAVLKTVS